jgi:hypothetical protein
VSFLHGFGQLGQVRIAGRRYGLRRIDRHHHRPLIVA